MTKIVKELIKAAEEAVEWMKEATCPNELNSVLRTLQSAIEKAKNEEKNKIRTGYLLLIEHRDGRKRITATVECPENYISRVGWASAGVEASVMYSEEVKDLNWARDDLRVLLPDERWRAGGMDWSDTSKEDLIAAMKAIAESINNHRQ